MNFHKTIGFLAAFLLMVGLGAPDSFAQKVTVRVSPSSVDEGETDLVTVSVTLSEAPGAGNTVSIAITLDEASLHTLTAQGDDTSPFPAIEISGTGTTGMSKANVMGNQNTTYNHPEKKVVTVTATASDVGGDPPDYDPGTDTFTIDDDDEPIGALSLSAAPPSLTVGGTSTTTLTVGVAEAIDDVSGLSVTITSILNDDPDDPGSIESATIVDEEKTGTTTFSVSDVAAAGSVTVTASAVGYEDATLRIEIIDRIADDIEGFRVTIAHDNGEWVGFGNKKVKVDVTRLNSSAYRWTRFENIVVALRDTVPITGGPSEGNIYTLTASGLSLDSDGDLDFSITASAGGEFPKNSAISYSVADDRLTFQFQLVEIPGIDAATNRDAAAVLASAVTALGDVADEDGAAPDHPRHGDTAKGQRRGVYASASFGDAGTINSNDDESEVFSSPASLANVDADDQTVGDGKLIRIDLLAPDNIAGDKLEVSLDGEDEPLEEDAKLKIDDEIDISVSVDEQARFRDTGVLIEVKTQEVEAQNDDTVVGKAGTPLHKEEFSQGDVVDEVGESLETSFTLDAGSIMVKAKDDSKTRDGEEIAKDALFEPDNVPIRISVVTTDQAGNPSASENFDFIADTRKPVIHVVHPTSDDAHFSGLFDGSESKIDDYLKPLKIRVDEDLQSLNVWINDKQKISLWGEPGNEANDDLSDVVGEAVESVGDTIVYNTADLVIDNKATPTPTSSADNPGGSTKKLVLEAVDKVGNKTKLELPGVTHDNYEPMITNFFPNNSDLEGDDNLINSDTRHPVITLPEDVDSIAVVYDASSGKDITESVSGVTSAGDKEVSITTDFVQDRKYSLTIFVRDLAGNAFRTDRNDAKNMKFDEQFDNPKANTFEVTNRTGNEDPKKASAGVIAGQAFVLDIQAADSDDPADADADSRPAVTYKNEDEDGNQASEVRISAQDMNGELVSTVWFEGDGVMDDADSPDGMATLDAATWRLGKRRVFAKSNKIVDDMTILVEHRNAGGDGTSMVALNGSIEGLYVDAADFNKFNLIALEDGEPADEIWGAFTLKVVPADRHGNPSVKAFRNLPDEPTATDSLKLLDGDGGVDKKVGGVTQGFNYKNGIRASLISAPPIGALAVTGFQWTIPLEGAEFQLVAPSNVPEVSVQAVVVNESVDPGDTRSKNILSTTFPPFKVVQPVDITITLWGPGGENWTDLEALETPADGSEIMVTFRAEGFSEGDKVTFTHNGEEVEDAVEASAEGHAGQPGWLEWLGHCDREGGAWYVFERSVLRLCRGTC